MDAFAGNFDAWRRLCRAAVAISLGAFAFAGTTPAFGTNWTFNWGTAAQNWPLTGWTTNAWPACGGNTTVSNSRTFSNVNASNIDIKATITVTAGCFINNGCSGGACPALDYNATGGATGSPADLDLNVDFTNLTTSNVTVKVEFFATGTTTPVTVAVPGWVARDIDRTTSSPFWQDVVKVTAVDGGGGTVNPDFISQFVANGSENWTPASPAPAGTNTLSAKGTANLASTNQAGWATFVFASQKVQSMTMQWTAGDGGGTSNPGAQRIFLSNFVFSNIAITTQAIIAGVRAYADSGAGWVEWETASEIGTAGFNLYQRDSASGRFVRVNDRLLPALFGAPHGGTYRFPVADAVPGDARAYVLEEVEATGSTRLYGPFTVTVGAKRPASGVARATSAAASGGAVATARAEYSRQPRPPSGRQDGSPGSGRVTPNARAMAVASDKAVGAAKPNSAVRILVDDEGLYAVTADQIAAALGVNAQQVRSWIDKGQLRVQQKGEPVAWLGGPGNDRIMFYGQALDGADAVHARHNVYWLDRANGPTMKVVNGKGPTPVATGQGFPSRKHAEENNCPVTFVADDPDADFWYANAVQVSASGQYHVDTDCFSPLAGPPSFALPAPDPLPIGTATLRAYLQGATDLGPGNDHHARVRVNGTAVGEVEWDGIAPKTLAASFPASLLAAGGSNSVSVEGSLAPGASYSVFWIDGFDLDYPRAYRAVGDQLRFRGAGNRVVTVGGFGAADIRVLDIGNPRKPQWLASTTVTAEGTGYAVSLAPARPDTDYLAALPRAPVAVEGASPPALKGMDGDSAARYLVLTPRSLRAGADALAAYRQGKVIELEDIYDVFSDGIANPNAIRDFLAYAYQNWKPKPRLAALVGKGTIDPKDYLGYGTNRFPVLMSPTPHGLFASDNRYADFDGNGVPQLAIGRVPALSNGDVTDYVAKLAAYEHSGAQPRRALVVADVPDDAGNFTANGREVVHALEADAFHTVALNLADLSAADAHQAIVETLNPPGGVDVFNYIGHGGVNVLGMTPVFDNGSVSELGNAARLPVFLAFTCAAGDGTYPGFDSLTEILLWRRGGGAIAAIAPTGLSDNGQAHTLNLSVIDALVGPRASATLGEANAAALADLAKKGGERYMLDKYGVTGDPALRVQR